MEEALTTLRNLRRSTDLIEIRIDRLKNLELQKLLRPPRPGVIITNRHRDEGGGFAGTAEEQFDTLCAALRAGAEYVDVELRWGARHISRLLSAAPGARLIVSHHDLEKTPSDLRPVLKRLCATPGHILKLVTTANDITDNRRLFDLLSRYRGARRPLAAFCMGERGQISRILGAKFGGALTYSAANEDEPTAAGQLSVEELKKIYRVPTLNRSTRVFGLVGNPVSHSAGVRFHNAVFARRALNAVYVNFLVDDVRSFLPAFRNDIAGLSVTMPFKQEIIPLLDRVDEDASFLQSVNTVTARRGKLTGFNTDYAGVRRILRKRTMLRGKRAIVLGTGATAATMAYAAINAGASTTIVGRSGRRAKSLGSRLNCSWATFDDLPHLAAEMIMNGTPVGMASQPPESPVPRTLLRPGVTVFDAVYNPPMTLLLQEARDSGCDIIPGTDLFTEQARLQSKLFLAGVA